MKAAETSQSLTTQQLGALAAAVKGMPYLTTQLVRGLALSALLWLAGGDSDDGFEVLFFSPSFHVNLRQELSLRQVVIGNWLDHFRAELISRYFAAHYASRDLCSRLLPLSNAADSGSVQVASGGAVPSICDALRKPRMVCNWGCEPGNTGRSSSWMNPPEPIRLEQQPKWWIRQSEPGCPAGMSTEISPMNIRQHGPYRASPLDLVQPSLFQALICDQQCCTMLIKCHKQ